uniref:Glycoprotein hormone subunit beta domain-containing protein n=1 Tax=Chelonoidis abingdonii TaxID=106734 RepID=A0A8C0JDV9_CHEAB
KVRGGALAPVSQHVCSYRAVRYETLALPVCPPGVDPAFTFPVALSCHCSLCLMDSSDCTVHRIQSPHLPLDLSS